MDLRSLEVFMEVAELGSFTRAGDRLGYSQPTVSFQIKQLERELGTKLFDRIGRTVSLTDAGRDALVYAQEILHMSREMALGASRHREPRGIVRLGMADSLCGPMIAGHFDRFRDAFPQVSLRIRTGGTEELLAMLDCNEVDLVCTLDSHVYNTAYVIESESPIGVHFVVCAANPLAQKQSVTMEELLELPFLLTEAGVSYRRLLEEHLAKESSEIRPVLEIARADLICGLVARDMGAAFLPDYVTEEAAREGTVARLNVAEFHADLWRQLIRRRDKWVSAPMNAMIDHLTMIDL